MSSWFVYWCDTCELLVLGYSWVTWEEIHLVNRMLRSFLKSRCCSLQLNHMLAFLVMILHVIISHIC
jgi:hypothetical protein